MNANMTPLTKRYQILFAVVCLGLVAVVDLQSHGGMARDTRIAISGFNPSSQTGSPSGAVLRKRSSVTPVAVILSSVGDGVAFAPFNRVDTMEALSLPPLSLAGERTKAAFAETLESLLAFDTAFLCAGCGSSLERGISFPYAGGCGALWRASLSLHHSVEGFAADRANLLRCTRFTVAMVRISRSSELGNVAFPRTVNAYSESNEFLAARRAYFLVKSVFSVTKIRAHGDQGRIVFSHSIFLKSIWSGLRSGANAVVARSYFTAKGASFA